MNVDNISITSNCLIFKVITYKTKLQNIFLYTTQNKQNIIDSSKWPTHTHTTDTTNFLIYPQSSSLVNKWQFDEMLKLLCPTHSSWSSAHLYVCSILYMLRLKKKTAKHATNSWYDIPFVINEYTSKNLHTTIFSLCFETISDMYVNQ